MLWKPDCEKHRLTSTVFSFLEFLFKRVHAFYPSEIRAEIQNTVQVVYQSFQWKNDKINKKEKIPGFVFTSLATQKLVVNHERFLKLLPRFNTVI